MSFKKSHLTIFISIFLYKTFLHIAYVGFVYKKFEYMGFTYDFNPYKYFFSIILLLCAFISLPKNKDRPSHIFLQLHLIIMMIPMLVIYYTMNKSTMFVSVSFVVFILQCISSEHLPILKIKKIKNSKLLLHLIISSLSIFVYISMLRANGLPSISSLNILSVYDFRSDVKYPFLMSYLVNWQAKVINPFLITTFYLKKEKTKTTIAIIMQVIIYMITGHKAYLFIPIAILIIIKFINKVDFLRSISNGALFSTITLYMIHVISKSILLPSLFLRRFLLLPAYIKFLYYDFFSNNEYLYFSAGFIGKILNKEYPYHLPPAFLIGDIFFNDPQSGANTGYLADAYANMGIIGMFIIGVLFAIVLKIIDSLGMKIGKEITIGLSLFLILSLNDSAFLTTLLTGGLMFLIFVLFLYSSDSNNTVNHR